MSEEGPGLLRDIAERLLLVWLGWLAAMGVCYPTLLLVSEERTAALLTGLPCLLIPFLGQSFGEVLIACQTHWKRQRKWSGQARERGERVRERAAPFTHILCPIDGTLAAWYVKVGEQVEVHTTVGTLTDKQGTTVPIISPYSGTVAAIQKAPGEEVEPWTALLRLADARNDQGRNMSNAFHHHLNRWLHRIAWRYDPTTIAIALKVSGPTSWMWLIGMRHPTEEELVALAALCGASEEELEAAREAIATIPPIALPGQSEDLKP